MAWREGTEKMRAVPAKCGTLCHYEKDIQWEFPIIGIDWQWDFKQVFILGFIIPLCVFSCSTHFCISPLSPNEKKKKICCLRQLLEWRKGIGEATFTKPGQSKVKFRENNSYRAEMIRRVTDPSKPRAEIHSKRGQGDHLLSLMSCHTTVSMGRMHLKIDFKKQKWLLVWQIQRCGRGCEKQRELR